MQKVSVFFAAVIFVASSTFAAAQIQSMKLLAPEVGWAATSQNLYWTTNAGAQWKDITPKLNHKWQAVSSVFFLNSSIGWVVLNCADHGNEATDDTCFELALTANSGESWSIAHPIILDPDPESGFSGRSFLAFADPVHGWMILKVSKNVSVSSGIMLRTNDGGKTWKQLPSPPIADEIRFVTDRDGWLAGGPNGELYLTHDGGEHWRRLDLGLIPGVSPDSIYAYDLPIIENSKHGVLPVTITNIMSPDASIAVFSTYDGGNSWKRTAVVSGLPTVQGHFPTAAAGLKLIAVKFVAGQGLTLYSVDGQNVSQSNSRYRGANAVVHQASFVSLAVGWVVAGSQLLLTSDGGAAWTDITPGGKPPKTGAQLHRSRPAVNHQITRSSPSTNLVETHAVAGSTGFIATPQ